MERERERDTIDISRYRSNLRGRDTIEEREILLTSVDTDQI